MATEDGNKTFPSASTPPNLAQYPGHECVDRPNLPCPACVAAGVTPSPFPLSLILMVLVPFLFSFLSPAHAVDNYTTTPTFSFVDNTPNCLATASINCWTALPGTVSQIAVGADSSVYGVSSTHIYKLPGSTHTTTAAWVQLALPTVPKIAVQDAANIYGISQSGFCAAGTYEVFKANAALTAWVGVTPLGCVKDIAVAFDGTVVGVNSPTAYILKPGATVWAALPGSGYNSRITVQNQHTAFALVGTTVYRINVDLNTVQSIPGIAATDISADVMGTLWMVGGTNSTGNGNLYSLDTVTNGAAVKAYRGIYNQVATGDMDHTFAILNSNFSVYHFRHTVIAAQATFTGSYNCAASFPITGVCPSPATHTARVQIAFQAGGLHGVNGVLATQALPPTGGFNVQAIEHGVGCDFFFGNPNGPECTLASTLSTAKVFCSIMGALYNYIMPTSQVEEAITKSKWTGLSINLVGWQTSCAVQDWCKPGGGPVFGNPPLAPYTVVTQRPVTGLGPQAQCSPYYYEKSLCLRYRGPGLTWGLWHCTPEPLSTALGNGAYGSADSSVGSCTGSWAWWNSLP